MKELKEAFLNYDVKLEKHKGNINYFVSDKSFICPKYNIGDIVFVKKNDVTEDNNHLFVIVDANKFIGKLITTNNQGILVKKNNLNNLINDSYIVNDLYKLDPSKILFKIGELDEYKNYSE